mmetsp:Transcript_81530/g.95045  ORF Transcript_81530/g.95045 Transcript_81530/m.95045 type:complete len:106 (+) Transcript_81530:3-320(+)
MSPFIPNMIKDAAAASSYPHNLNAASQPFNNPMYQRQEFYQDAINPVYPGQINRMAAPIENSGFTLRFPGKEGEGPQIYQPSVLSRNQMPGESEMYQQKEGWHNP